MEQVVKNSCLVDYITDFIARLVIITYFTNILSDEHVNENLIHVVIYVFNCAKHDILWIFYNTWIK